MFRKIAFGATALALAAAVAGCHEPGKEDQPSPPAPPATTNSEVPDYAPVPIYIPNGSGGSTLLFI